MVVSLSNEIPHGGGLRTPGLRPEGELDDVLAMTGTPSAVGTATRAITASIMERRISGIVI